MIALQGEMPLVVYIGWACVLRRSCAPLCSPPSADLCKQFRCHWLAVEAVARA